MEKYIVSCWKNSRFDLINIGWDEVKNAKTGKKGHLIQFVILGIGFIIIICKKK